MKRTKDDNQQLEPHGLSRRDMLAGLGGSAAALSMTQLAAAETPAQDANAAAGAKSGENLLDDRYKSKSGNQFGSQVIHHGEMAGYNVTPISQDKASPGYQRPGNMSNPTVAPLLKKMMEAEGTESAVGAPCGMGAISQTYLALLKPGDRLVTHRCNYDWVMTLFGQYLRSLGIKVEFLDFTKPENLAAALKAKPAKIVHWEPYVNPTMEVLDSPTLIDIAKKAGALVILDNTWLTPYLFQPARLGADLVIHSVTKYVGGHGNAMGGVVSGRKNLIGKIGRAQSWLGGLMRPMDAFLITQGIKTLPIRMRQHCQSAQQVAEFLQSHPA
ncbi:MAG: aminotransferase class V-fold PLP-dependent enzyme, partial [Phycisphaerae bacterium]|nr:aminotransferase class V-fold PLP-dependent enzyme [Phycisphaerae bacterium]